MPSMKQLDRWIPLSLLACSLLACSGGSGGGTGSGGSGTGGAAGSTNTGGGSGGHVAAGGVSGTGGLIGTGGVSATGGVIGTGGVTGTGGVAHTGGAGGKATGGSAAAGSGGGGGKATGGASGGAGAGGVAGSPGSGGSGAVTVSCSGLAPGGMTPAWCSCDLFGSWSSGPATLYNDVWGSGPGPQCIWSISSSHFGVLANHPTTSGIKSYPNVSYSPGQAISALGSYTSSFDITVPSSGSWESAYDIWVKNGNRIEIMLWMYKSGGVGPIASKYDASGAAVPDVANVNVGNHTWNVYYGSNGSNDVVSLLRTSNTTSGMVDIKAILAWIISNKGSFTSSWTLDQVQFGFEITSDGNPQSFTVNSFSVSST